MPAKRYAIMNRLVLLLFVMATAVGVSYGMHGPVLPVFTKNVIGATYTELSLIGIVNFLPYMVIPIFVGILLGRINNGYLLTLGALLNTISLFMTSTATTVEELIVYRAMIGVAHAFIWPPSEAIFTHDPNTRVKNISWFIMFFAIGFMVGPLLGTLILETIGPDYRLLFQITSYVMVVAMAFTVMTYSKATKEGSGKINLKSFGRILKFPVVVTMLIFSTATFGIILTIYPAFLNDRGMDDVAILLLYFIFGITRVGSLLLANFFSSRAVPTFVASTVMVTMGMGISAVGTTFAEFAVALLLLGFGFSILYPLALEVILQGSKKNVWGRMIGAYEALFGIGWVIGPAVSWYMSQSYEPAIVYWLFCWLGVAVSAMSIIFHRRLRLVSSRRQNHH